MCAGTLGAYDDESSQHHCADGVPNGVAVGIGSLM
jgi:hypothetical protein